MNKNKRLLVVMLSVLAISSAFAENKIVSEYRDDGSMELKLLPESKYSEKIKASIIQKNEDKYPFTYEGLYYLNKKELLELSNSSETTIKIDDVSRICRSLSKMQGMKYYSTTKKKECVLYSKVFMIADEKGKTPIPDQNTGNADGQVSYCLQDDNSFGVNRYKLNYFQSDNCMLAQFTILDSMGLGPFKAIYPGKMVINILVIDQGDDLLLYLNTDLESVKYPGIKGQITDSMTSRMDAVYKWFITQF